MPYNPQIVNIPVRADMGGWGNALMQILGDKSARQEREAEQAKQNASEFKTLVAYGETLGLDKNDLMTKDLDTVRGTVRGLTAKQEFQKAGEELKRIMGERQSNEALARAARDTGQMNSGEALNLGQGPIIPPQLPMQQRTPGRFLEQIMANPEAINARNAIPLLEAMQRGGGGESPLPYIPEPFEVGGIKGIVSPRTGSIHTINTPGGMSTDDRLRTIDRTALQKRKTDITKALGSYLTPDVKEFYTRELEGINAQLAQSPVANGPEAGGDGRARYKLVNGKLELVQ